MEKHIVQRTTVDFENALTRTVTDYYSDGSIRTYYENKVTGMRQYFVKDGPTTVTLSYVASASVQP